MERYKRPSRQNQQTSTAVRPPLPRDATKNGMNRLNGKMPNGYTAIWDFGNGTQTKESPTSGGGCKVC